MGSNLEPEKNLSAAAAEIRKRFPKARFSRIYQSHAMGMQGPDFLNSCCCFDTALSPNLLEEWLKGIEAKQKRDRSLGSWVPRTLDLDLLMLGGQVLDEDLFRFAHLYLPASELMSLKKVDHDREPPRVLTGFNLMKS